MMKTQLLKMSTLLIGCNSMVCLTVILAMSLPLLAVALVFLFNDTATTEIYTLSLHDALPICDGHRDADVDQRRRHRELQRDEHGRPDRKSTRLNSSHPSNSYAVFCLKKKNSDHRHVGKEPAVQSVGASREAGHQIERRTVEQVFFFFNDTATTEIYTLSLHDALPISRHRRGTAPPRAGRRERAGGRRSAASGDRGGQRRDGRRREPGGDRRGRAGRPGPRPRGARQGSPTRGRARRSAPARDRARVRAGRPTRRP